MSDASRLTANRPGELRRRIALYSDTKNRASVFDFLLRGAQDSIGDQRTVSGQGGKLARRRYQKGQLLLLGTREKRWFGRWYEDLIEADRVRRVRRQEFLGTLKELPTKGWRSESWIISWL